MNWKFVLIGLALLGLSAFAQAAYNPYINNEYGRPYYSQFYAYPGISREAQIYSYGGYAVYSPYYYYRSPAAFVAPTYTVYMPPVIPVTPVVYSRTVVYREPVGLVSTVKEYGSRIGASFTVLFAG